MTATEIKRASLSQEYKNLYKPGLIRRFLMNFSLMTGQISWSFGKGGTGNVADERTDYSKKEIETNNKIDKILYGVK